MATNASLVRFSPYSKGQPVAQTRAGVNDANYTVGTNEYIVGFTALSATRTITLPGTTAIGRRLVIKDESGSCTTLRKLVINGSIDGAQSLEITQAYGWVELYFNGNAWGRVA